MTPVEMDDPDFKTSNGQHAPFKATVEAVGMRRVRVRAIAKVNGETVMFDLEFDADRMSPAQVDQNALRKVRDWLNSRY